MLDDISRSHLIEARRLVATPEQWTRGTFARGPDGFPRDPSNPQAVRFCLAGALYRVSRWKVDLEAVESAVLAGTRYRTIAIFNDSVSHAVLLRAIDRAVSATAEKTPSRRQFLATNHLIKNSSATLI